MGVLLIVDLQNQHLQKVHQDILPSVHFFLIVDLQTQLLQRVHQDRILLSFLSVLISSWVWKIFLLRVHLEHSFHRNHHRDRPLPCLYAPAFHHQYFFLQISSSWPLKVSVSISPSEPPFLELSPFYIPKSQSSNFLSLSWQFFCQVSRLQEPLGQVHHQLEYRSRSSSSLPWFLPLDLQFLDLFLPFLFPLYWVPQNLSFFSLQVPGDPFLLLLWVSFSISLFSFFPYGTLS